MIEWICKIRKKEEDNMISYNIILLSVFIVGVSHCELNGNHIELTLGIGPLSGSVGFSVWSTILP